MRKVLETTTIKTVRKSGKTYEFGQTVEHGFYSSFPHATYFPELRQTWARVHNGYQWQTLHYIVSEH